MPQVSKRYIKEEKKDKIFRLFYDFIASTNQQNKIEIVLDEVLTPTEKVMVAKRIACFYLLLKEIPLVEICGALKLSCSTVHYFKFILDSKPKLKEFVSVKLAEEKVINLLKNTFVEFWFGIPRKGTNWSYQKEQYFKHKKALQEPF